MTPDDVVTVAAALDTRPRKEPWGFNFNNFPVLSRFEGLLSPPASSDPFDAFHHSNPQQQQQTLGSSSRVMNIDIDRRVHPEGSGLDFDSSAVLSEDVLVFHKATWRYAAQMVAFLTPQEQAALYFTAARVFPSALAVPPTAAERAEAESLHKALKAGKIQSPPLNLSELPLSELIQCLYASEAIRAQIRAHAAQAAQLVAAVEAERETGKTNKGYRHSESTAQAPPEQFELDPSFLIFTETLPLTRYSSEDFEAEIIKRIGASSPSQGALSVMDLGRVIRWRCETLKQVKRDTQIGETLKKSGLASALGVNVSEEQAAADEAAEGNDTIIRDKFILACLRRLTSHFVSSNPLASVARGVERLEEIRAAQAARRGTGSADAVRAQAIQRRQQDSSQRKDERYAFLSSVQALRLIWREISESVLSHQQELLDDEGGGGSEEKGGKRGALVSTAELLSLYDQALGALVSYGLRAASEGGMSLDEICALYALLHDTTGQHTMVFSDRQMICVEDAPPPLPETVVERLRERGDSSEASQPFDWSQHLLSQTVRGDGRMNPGVEALRLGRGGTRSAFLGRDRGAFYSNQAPARPHGPTLRLPWRQIYSAFASRVLSTLKERTRRFSEQIAENTYTEEEIENNNRNKKFLPPMIFDGMWKVKAFYVASVCRDLARSQVLDPEIWQGLSKMVVVYREFLTLEDCKQILVALLWLLTEYVQAVMNGPIGDGVEWKEEEERNSQGQQRQKQRQSDSSVLAQSLSGPFPPPVDKTTKVSEDTREYLLSLLTADPEEDEEEEEESTLSKAAAENKHPATPAGGLADMRSLSGSSFLHAALESSSLTGPPSEPPLLSKPLKTLEALRAILLAVQAVNSRVRLFLKHEWEEPARIPKKTSPMLKRFIGISHAMGKSYLPGLARLGPAIDRLESQAKGVLLSSSAGQQQMQQGNLQETGEGQGVERGTLRISGLATGVRLETSRCLEQSRFLSLSVQNRIFGIGYSMSLSELSHLIGEEMGPFGVSSFFRIDSRLHSSRSRRGPSGKGEDVVRSSADGPFGFRWAAVGERERKRLASELAKRGVATPDEEAFGDQLMDVPQEEREERGRALFAFPAGELDDDGDDNEGRRKNRNAASGEETGEEMERGDTGLVDIEPDGGFVPDVVMSRIGNCAFDPSRILQFLQLLSVRETAEMLRWGWATRTLTVPFAELALLRIKSSWEWAQHQKEQPESKKGKRGRDRDGAGAPSQSTLTPPQTVLIARILEQLPSHSPVWLSDLSLSPSPPVADSLEEDEEGDEETAASARHRGSIEGLEDDWGDAGEPAESEYEEYNSDFRETSSADWKSGGRLEEIESWEEDEPEWEGRGRERGEGVQNRRGQWGHHSQTSHKEL
uniref:Uncharacterized protein n=1 Tax=Chromera velia CCMP2878 TaxID=1169474 RepID=A0A0G4FHY8_9ALVE|eukprot:Cvel_3324.t1-p1 / transcript=Cvel_3324.t1 / gene=Cvel_3324 / organism=Chromera_velia_CCMP2878 / gene_product=hypothetical protein / transcript_product=hypothetical protein / location=Cvel_scaffold132:40053-45964(+) / protein_length=1377 / sequence_SO=supercontig / SO=protein_coding / is_pseudo=false